MQLQGYNKAEKLEFFSIYRHKTVMFFFKKKYLNKTFFFCKRLTEKVLP